jgi:SagB-type dehydrogenase family enzyme
LSNRDLEAARAYHDLTKHSYRSVRLHPGSLDWANQPRPFKIYPSLEALPLPRDFASSGVPALEAIVETGAAPRAEARPDLKTLGALLFFSAGITRRRTYPGGEIFFRAAACTGALYEIDFYLVAGELVDLPAGVYHFSPADFALRRLRQGDFRGELARATAADSSVAHAPVVVVSTGTYWRNAWKYQARTYRHFGWDNGTMLANLLAVGRAHGLPARLVLGFVDEEVNRLLDLDTEKEAAVSLTTVGYAGEPAPELRFAESGGLHRSPETGPPGEVPALGLETVPASAREVDYPEMRAVHAASSLASPEEVANWRRPLEQRPAIAEAGHFVPLEAAAPVPDSIEQVILRRGSTRRFDRASITFAQLSTILDRAVRGLAADFLEPEGVLLNDLYLIVHAVEGLAPGRYFYDRARRGLACLAEGQFRSQAHYLALEQDLAGDASVNVYFLADLDRVLESFGNRGYRAVQLEAGILGGRMYLGAYAERLGATGLTFYDDEVVEFFSPHAAGKSAIFLVALGKPAKRRD